MERDRTEFRSRCGPVLSALVRRVRAHFDHRDQLAIVFESCELRSADELFARLKQQGLRGVHELKLTNNRRTMVSIASRTLRVQEGFLNAPSTVHQAIADFVMARRGPAKLSAQRQIVAHAATIELAPRGRRVERTHPDDAALATRIAEWHQKYNDEKFNGELSTIPIRVSRRMKSRLGHYTPKRAGVTPEIAISRGHFRRHGLEETLHTLLHEMVHQWQDERGLVVDHGPLFRRKARAVGALPAATRALK